MGALLSYLGQIDYHPAVFIGSTATDAQTTIIPAGAENVTDAYSYQWFKDPLDPAFADDEAIQQFRDDLEEYSPDTEPTALSLHGYGIAAAIVTALREADEISSEASSRPGTPSQARTTPCSSTARRSRRDRRATHLRVPVEAVRR